MSTPKSGWPLVLVLVALLATSGGATLLAATYDEDPLAKLHEHLMQLHGHHAKAHAAKKAEGPDMAKLHEHLMQLHGKRPEPAREREMRDRDLHARILAHLRALHDLLFEWFHSRYHHEDERPHDGPLHRAIRAI